MYQHAVEQTFNYSAIYPGANDTNSMPTLCVHTSSQSICLCKIAYVFIGGYLATNVLIGNLLAMGRGWVIIKYANDELRTK